MHVLRPQFPISRGNNFSLHSQWEICSISLESNFLDDLGESPAPNVLAFQDLVYRVMAHARTAFDGDLSALFRMANELR